MVVRVFLRDSPARKDLVAVLWTGPRDSLMLAYRGINVEDTTTKITGSIDEIVRRLRKLYMPDSIVVIEESGPWGVRLCACAPQMLGYGLQEPLSAFNATMDAYEASGCGSMPRIVEATTGGVPHITPTH